MNPPSHCDSIIVSEEEKDLRLDKLLAIHFGDFSRTYFQDLIAKGKVLVNGEISKKREKTIPGDEVEICFELTEELSLSAENIPLEILFEDEHLLVINKPANMVVHPAPGHPNHTFVNALLYHCKNLEQMGSDPLRPGIVHRLDKDTTGLLIAAKTSLSHRLLIELFSQRKIQKKYLAICYGAPKEGIVSAPIKRHPTKRQEMSVRLTEGKEAISDIRVLKTSSPFSLVEVALITGRTHQIRVHLKHLKAPVLGDPVYGIASINEKLGLTRQLLHAHTLAFIHPITKQQITLTAPLPTDMENFLSKTLL